LFLVEINLISKERTYSEKFSDIISEPWFISITIMLCLITFIMLTFCFCFIFKRLNKRREFSSTTSSETTLNANKMNNGTRYKLVNDTIWMDTLHSSNHSNQDCCCVPDIHHQLFVQKSKH
jgi:hypothetical protein